MLTVQTVARVMPAHLKNAITQSLVDKVNNAANDPIIAEQIRDNFISYTSVLQTGKYKTEDYLNAVSYVSYKLLGHNNFDAYVKTFPQRYQRLVANGMPTKDIASFVGAYARNKLVNLIIEQSLVPSWVLNQDLYQRALNVQADLMVNAKSEMVRSKAAEVILTQLAKPKDTNPLINIDLRENSGMTELKDALAAMAKQQQSLINSGVSTKSIAEAKIIEAA